ncbi:13238_t:CDS:2 [Funneliformis geosporum]|nr:13238_t:CDS:2 [Funneliformis geosporum]
MKHTTHVSKKAKKMYDNAIFLKIDPQRLCHNLYDDQPHRRTFFPFDTLFDKLDAPTT